MTDDSTAQYKLVQLQNGAWGLHSLAVGETCHPAIGPVAEAETLYIRGLQLLSRLQRHRGEFVIWDVGLGAAANALTILRACQEVPSTLRLISFDHTLEPLSFGLQHADKLGYFSGFESPVQELLSEHRTHFQQHHETVAWELHLGDFPSLLHQPLAPTLPKPDAIVFDPYSPAKNPAMWTLPLFTQLFRLLDPQRPCAMPTYSRSTMLRVTLLLAGWYVGRGHATGQKEETTIAANTRALIAEPLDQSWLEKVARSGSAEPLQEPVYRQAPLSPASWEKLREHPQFK